LISEVLASGATILDVAGAQGNFSIALAEMGYEVTWNDLRAELADYVRLKQERGNIRFAPGNALELDFPSLFDGVLITEIIEHTAHPDDFLARIAKLVRPGGYVFMTTPNGAYCLNTLPKFSECLNSTVYEERQFKPNADGHIFLIHPAEIPSLARSAGLKIDRLELFTNPLTAGHMKLEHLLRILPKGLIEGVEILSQKMIGIAGRRLLVQMAVRFRR
jgi:2-polyprenyl-6-hydroxyphenyl methylase/3-demethylubiquinone-9 3-methyltransferase